MNNDDFDKAMADIEKRSKERADFIVRLAQQHGGLPRSAMEIAAPQLRDEGILGPVIAELLSRGETALGNGLAEFA